MSVLPALRVVGTDPSLDELAATANHEHRCAVRSAQDVLDHARRAGEALLKARARCKEHGEKWLPWLAANCQFSRSSCYAYMTLAKASADGRVPAAGTLAGVLAELAITRVVQPSTSDFDDDILKSDPRQAWLWSDAELPLSPRDPALQREAMVREDGHTYRCPCCAKEWSGDPRPPLRGALAHRSPGWAKAKIRKLTKKQIEQNNRAIRAGWAARRPT